MQAQWNHDRAYYHCRFPEDYPSGSEDHPKSLYVKEEALVAGLDHWLAELFDDDHIADTCTQRAGTSQPDDQAEAREAQLREQLHDCDQRLERYRGVLDQGGDPATVAKWINDAERERKTIAAQLGTPAGNTQLTREQVKALVAGLRDITEALSAADPHDKADVYKELGITLTYHPDGRGKVQTIPRGVTVRVGGPTAALETRQNPRSEVLTLGSSDQCMEATRQRLDALARREPPAVGGPGI